MTWVPPSTVTNTCREVGFNYPNVYGEAKRSRLADGSRQLGCSFCDGLGSSQLPSTEVLHYNSPSKSFR